MIDLPELRKRFSERFAESCVRLSQIIGSAGSTGISREGLLAQVSASRARGEIFRFGYRNEIDNVLQQMSMEGKLIIKNKNPNGMPDFYYFLN